jgi:hypothetical protein
LKLRAGKNTFKVKEELRRREETDVDMISFAG